MPRAKDISWWRHLAHPHQSTSQRDIVLLACSYRVETQLWQDCMLLDTWKHCTENFLCQLGGVKTCRILGKEKIDNSGAHICGFVKPTCGSHSLMVAQVSKPWLQKKLRLNRQPARDFSYRFLVREMQLRHLLLGSQLGSSRKRRERDQHHQADDPEETTSSHLPAGSRNCHMFYARITLFGK